MTTEQQNNVILTIDPRKSRLRLYKTTLHALGDPKFIQFLISQKQRNFAIRAVEKEFTDAQQNAVDVDKDGKVTLSDLARMRQFLSKIIEAF